MVSSTITRTRGIATDCFLKGGEESCAWAVGKKTEKKIKMMFAFKMKLTTIQSSDCKIN